jgi:predicted O-methyltransferase YrrM
MFKRLQQKLTDFVESKVSTLESNLKQEFERLEAKLLDAEQQNLATLQQHMDSATKQESARLETKLLQTQQANLSTLQENINSAAAEKIAQLEAKLLDAEQANLTTLQQHIDSATKQQSERLEAQLLQTEHASLASLQQHIDSATKQEGQRLEAKLLQTEQQSFDTLQENINSVAAEKIAQLESKLLDDGKRISKQTTRDLIIVQNRLYAQLQSLTWLQRRMRITGSLPPLRGWAASPDVLLRLHAHIRTTRPQVIVEFGSGASTLVIADALKQNKSGKLYSIEHSKQYGAETLANLKAEKLTNWVDLRCAELEPWEGAHLNDDPEKPSLWYAQALLNDIEQIDLIWVDGPPAVTCKYSRFPALPALADRITSTAEVWLDDTIRQEEKDICERWSQDHGLTVKHYALEKGLGRLVRMT